jgi:hypothetical protein
MLPYEIEWEDGRGNINPKVIDRWLTQIGSWYLRYVGNLYIFEVCFKEGIRVCL